MAVSAGAGGNVSGGVGQFAQAAAVNYLQALGAEQVKLCRLAGWRHPSGSGSLGTACHCGMRGCCSEWFRLMWGRRSGSGGQLGAECAVESVQLG